MIRWHMYYWIEYRTISFMLFIWGSATPMKYHWKFCNIFYYHVKAVVCIQSVPSNFITHILQFIFHVKQAFIMKMSEHIWTILKNTYTSYRRWYYFVCGSNFFQKYCSSFRINTYINDLSSIKNILINFNIGSKISEALNTY